MLKWLRLLGSMPLALLVVVFAFQTSPGFAGLNLCIGAGGHLEIESVEAGCCPSLKTAAPELTLAQVEGACASCIDVSLGGHSENTMAKSASPTAQVFLPTPALLERIKPLRLSSSVSLDRGKPDAPSLAAIRTIVLRV